jgi:hypothetical protein
LHAVLQVDDNDDDDDDGNNNIINRKLGFHFGLSLRDLFFEQYFTRTMSVNAIRTAVIAAVDAPVSLALFRLMQYAPLSMLRLMRRLSFALFRLMKYVPLSLLRFMYRVSLALFRLMQYAPLSNLRLMRRPSFTLFRSMQYVPLSLLQHLSSNATDHSSKIIQQRALLLTTQSGKQLVVDSVDRFEKGQEKSCTVASAFVHFPTDG